MKSTQDSHKPRLRAQKTCQPGRALGIDRESKKKRGGKAIPLLPSTAVLRWSGRTIPTRGAIPLPIAIEFLHNPHCGSLNVKYARFRDEGVMKEINLSEYFDRLSFDTLWIVTSHSHSSETASAFSDLLSAYVEYDRIAAEFAPHPQLPTIDMDKIL